MAKTGKKTTEGSTGKAGKGSKGTKQGNKAGRTYPEQGSDSSVKTPKKAC